MKDIMINEMLMKEDNMLFWKEPFKPFMDGCRWKIKNFHDLERGFEDFEKKCLG